MARLPVKFYLRSMRRFKARSLLKKRSVSFAYLLDLFLLISYMHVPPQKPDRRGPMPERLQPILRDLGLIPE